MTLRPWNDGGASSSASASNDVSGCRGRMPFGSCWMNVLADFQLLFEHQGTGRAEVRLIELYLVSVGGREPDAAYMSLVTGM